MRSFGKPGWLLVAAIAYAQSPARDHIDAGAKEMLASFDTAFELRAAQFSSAEIRLGELAARKAVDLNVKALGRQIADDQTKARDQLQSIAHRENMTLPNIPDASDESAYQRLSQLSGVAFDRTYLSTVSKDHERDSKDFQKEVRRGKNEDIKNFALQTLPLIEERMEKIRALESKAATRSAP